MKSEKLNDTEYNEAACVLLTCPCCVREVNLCDESVSVGSGLSEVCRFRMDHVTLAVWIQNLQRPEEAAGVGTQ